MHQKCFGRSMTTLFCRNTFLTISQHGSGTEGEIVSLFPTWSDSELATLILGVHLEIMVIVYIWIHVTSVNLFYCCCFFNEIPLFYCITSFGSSVSVPYLKNMLVWHLLPLYLARWFFVKDASRSSMKKTNLSTPTCSRNLQRGIQRWGVVIST